VGLASSQKTKAYGIYHDVPVVLGGITGRCKFFVLENLSQDVILGRPWERLVTVKHDNRDDGSCYTITYDEHGNTATFCSVPTHHEWNRAEAKFVTTNPQEHTRMPPYTCDGRKVVVSDTDNEKVQVDDESDMFMVRYEVNRVTVIEDPKSRVERLYTTIGHVNKADRTVRNNGQKDRSVGKRKKMMEALTLYKRKKDKILPANQSHTGGLKPGGDEDWKIKLVGNSSPVNIKYPWLSPKFSNIPRGTRLTAERFAGLKIGTGITNQEK